MRNRMRLIALCVLAVLYLSSCGKTTTNFDYGLENQILYVANGEEPRELDPQMATGSPESNINHALYEGLVTRNPKTLAIEPGVAESWRISEDGKTYTFQIRKSARWSNGDPVTAHDFVWSWQRALMPNLASEWAYMKYYIKNAEAFNTGEITDFSEVGVRANGDHELIVELVAPTNFFLQLVFHPSYFPVHKDTVLAHGAIDQGASNWTRPENWVGNGPFKLKNWEINKEISTEKNMQYWDAENVKLNGVVFFPIVDKQAEERAYRAKQVHVTYTPQLAIEKVAQYKENAPDEIRMTPVYASYYYEFNTSKPPMDDARVRRALAMAVDRDTLVERVTKAGEMPAYSLVPNDPEGYMPEKLFDYDPEKARALLAEAGYPNGEGFPTVELLYNTQDNHRKVALAVQQMLLENLNIKIELINQEWKVYLNTRRELIYNMSRAGWIADYLEPSNFFEILLSTSGNNNTGWGSAEYDALMAEIKATSDLEKRYALFAEANEILIAEMPVMPIYLYSDVNLVSPVVKGWYENVMHRHTYNHIYLEAND